MNNVPISSNWLLCLLFLITHHPHLHLFSLCSSENSSPLPSLPPILSFPDFHGRACCHVCNRVVCALFKHCQSFCSAKAQRLEICPKIKQEHCQHVCKTKSGDCTTSPPQPFFFVYLKAEQRQKNKKIWKIRKEVVYF